MKYDLVILCHPKDYVKLEFCIASCMRFFNPKPDGIYIVSPHGLKGANIVHIFDDDAIPIAKHDIKYRRSNWIYQQFIKLFQDFTQNDYYICVDSDLIFNRAIELFDGSAPKLFISDREQEHKAYFRFMKSLHDLEKQVKFSFINDFMMFHKSICREIAPDIGAMLEFCNDNLSDDFLLSEFELYGNYVVRHHPFKYKIQRTKTQLNGKYVHDPWHKEEIENLIEQNRAQDLDLFTIHSWT